ncbi:MAG: hypothetical protein ACHQ2Z_15265 [Elusimicrobiota bacterium]
MPPSKWPSKKQLEEMPANASIALARLRRALVENGGERSTEIVIDRTEGAVTAEPSTPMLSQIAAAIFALKAAGVQLRPVPTAIEGEIQKEE